MSVTKRIAPGKRILLVLLLMVAALATPATGGTARADDSQDPPAEISVSGTTSDDLKAQIADFNQSVTAQQSTKQALTAEKATIENQAATVNAALNADDAAGAETDKEFDELNSAISAYNSAGPPGDPSYAAELDSEGKQLAAQQDQNNAKVRADNADHDRVAAALTAHNKRAADYESTNQKLTAERATLMDQILADQAAAAMAVMFTMSTVDSLNGMDSPRQDQQYEQPATTNGGDTPAPATQSTCGHSFAAGTGVLTAAGTAEPIQDVRAGDLVENAQAGGGDEIHQVDQVHVTTTDADFTRLTVGTPTGPETVTGTSNHPYYDQSVGAFVNAADLKPGDHLQSPDPATDATVLGVQSYTGHMVTYDLTINGLHTYFVEAGGTPVLVHNCDFDAATESGSLPVRANNAGPTTGRSSVSGEDITSGQNADSLTKAAKAYVSARLKKLGMLRGGVFGDADHVEMKVAYLMEIEGIDNASVVINNIRGPCDNGPRALSCTTVLTPILGQKTLTVYWRDAAGQMQKATFGGVGR